MSSFLKYFYLIFRTRTISFVFHPEISLSELLWQDWSWWLPSLRPFCSCAPEGVTSASHPRPEAPSIPVLIPIRPTVTPANHIKWIFILTNRFNTLLKFFVILIVSIKSTRSIGLWVYIMATFFNCKGHSIDQFFSLLNKRCHTSSPIILSNPPFFCGIFLVK